jgi:PAS domain S-box-containing protein
MGDRLVDLLRQKEDWLIARILFYAQEHGYVRTRRPSPKRGAAFRAGLTEALAAALEKGEASGIEIKVHTDWDADSVTRFGLVEARRHRERGIDIGMFLGMFVYYRQAFWTASGSSCLRVGSGNGVSTSSCACSTASARRSAPNGRAWGSGFRACMAASLREMTNEKNRYLTFFESLVHPVIFVSPDGIIENLNRAAARLLDGNAAHGRDYYARRSAAGAASLCGEKAEKVFPWLADVLHEGEGTPEGALERSCGFPSSAGERLFQACVSRLPDVSDKFQGYAVLLQDVTEPLKNRTMILRAKEELERTFDTISDVVFLIDDSGVIQRANRSLTDKLGLTPRDVVGRTCREVLGCTECRLSAEGHQSREVSVRYPNLPGRFMVRSSELLDGEGKRIGRVVVSRDVTASDRIRETMETIESKYKSIFDHAPVGIFQSTPEGVYISVNRTMATMFGFRSVEDMINYYNDISSQMYVCPEDRDALIREGLEKDNISAKDVNLVRPDGSTFWGRLRGRLVRDAQGRVMYFEGFVEDVSRRREARESLARSDSFSGAWRRT